MPMEPEGGKHVRTLFLGAAASALALSGWALGPRVAGVFSLACTAAALSFFAGAFGHRKTAILLASLLAGPGALAVAERLLDWKTPETIHRALDALGPVSGFSVLLVGVALMASFGRISGPKRRLALVLAGGSVMSMAVAALSLHLLEHLSITDPVVITAVTIPEASTILMLGLLLAIHGWSPASDKDAPSLALPVAAGMAVLLTAVTLAILARAQQRAQIRRTTLLATEGIGGQAERGLYAHLLAAHRTIDRLEHLQKASSDRESTLETKMGDYQGLEAVGYLDAPDRLRWIVPRTVDTKPVLEHAAGLQESSNVFVFEPIALSDGPGFLVYERVPTRGESDRFRVGLFRYGPLFAKLLENSATGYELAIFHDDTLLFERASPGHEEIRKLWQEHIRLEWLGFSWTIAAWPTAETLYASRTMAPLGSILFGNLVAVLLAFSVQLAQTARSRSAALIELNDELASQIDERRLAEEKLMESQKLEAVGRLAGGVAHDFNNFLTVVHGYSELIRSRVQGEAARRYIGEIIKASQRASELTQQLLAFSRRQPRTAQPVDLNQIIREVQGMLSRLIGEDITLTVGGESSVIKADPSQLHQIIMNLAVNARDAMPAGGTLSISTSNVVIDDERAGALGFDGGRYAELTVRDTGIGMSESTMANIFEPFFTTKPRGRGTGLGLSTVYGIVQQSGGYIQAESAPEKGTTFRVYFPLTEEPLDETPVSPFREASPPGYEATVLLVEDDDAVREWIEEILHSAGYRVLVARDGERALFKLERSAQTIDILVTDVIMPHMGGVSLADILSERYPGLPVVFVSGYPNRSSPAKDDGAGSAYYLSKPFTATELLEKIRTVVDAAPV